MPEAPIEFTDTKPNGFLATELAPEILSRALEPFPLAVRTSFVPHRQFRRDNRRVGSGLRHRAQGPECGLGQRKPPINGSNM